MTLQVRLAGIAFVTALVSLFTAKGAGAASSPAGQDAIRPFTFTASDEALADLRKRIAATRWPEKETVTDATQGVQLATMQKLARYWATDYDCAGVRRS